MATTKKAPAKKAPAKTTKKAPAKKAEPTPQDAAAFNSAPHPELWPSPDSTDEKAPNAAIRIVPEAPSVNFEFTIQASGLAPMSGIVFRLDGTDFTGEPTFLTHKADPFGDAHVVWRSPRAGKQTVTVLTKNDAELGDALASATFEVIAPEEDDRLGEARGQA